MNLSDKIRHLGGSQWKPDKRYQYTEVEKELSTSVY